MCKKIFFTFVCSILIFVSCIPSFAQTSEPYVSAEAAILIIAGTNEVLFSKNADKCLSMASTTKIMTAVLAIEKGDFGKEITITDEMIKVEGTSSGLLKGDKIDLKTLLYCMMLQSGNDAANAVALFVGGSQQGFIELMNNKAEEIGMRNTHFSTASGLDAEDHYSTAYDMALLTSYALENSMFKEICSTYKITVSYGNPKYNRTITNHNKMLNSYDGLIGVKTGFTKKSGRCLVTAAERQGVRLICVTLDDWNDWEEHKRLLDYGFDNVKKTVAQANTDLKLSVVGGTENSVKAEMFYNPCFYSKNGEFKYTFWLQAEHFLYAPVQKDDIVGKVLFYDENGNKIGDVPLIASQTVNEKTVSEVISGNDDKKINLRRIFKFFKGEK